MQTTYNGKQGLQIGDWRVVTWEEGVKMGERGRKRGRKRQIFFFKVIWQGFEIEYIFFLV